LTGFYGAKTICTYCALKTASGDKVLSEFKQCFMNHAILKLPCHEIVGSGVFIVGTCPDLRFTLKNTFQCGFKFAKLSDFEGGILFSKIKN
jgi:hypothetical protein